MTASEKLDALRTIRDFLIANEQYGDDWNDEIRALDEIIDNYMSTEN